MAEAGGAAAAAGAAAAGASSWTSSLGTRLEVARKGLGRGLAWAGGAAVVSSLAVVAARFQATRADRQLPSEFVLELPLDRLHVVDAVDPSPWALLRGDTRQVELPKVVAALKRAAGDSRCRGLVTYVGARENLGGLATVQELRDAISDFRLNLAAAAANRASSGSGGAGASRSPGLPSAPAAVAFAASFGEAGGSGMVPYLLASACDRVYLQPSGLLGLVGLESRAFFARPLLDRLRAEPYVFAREEFKSAANTFRESGFTGPQRENLQTLLGDLADQMMATMAAARGVDGAAVREAVEAAPLLPAAALRRGLLDGTKYKDEVQSLYVISDKALAEEKARQGAKHKRRQDDTRMARVPIDKYIQVTELQQAAAARGPSGWLAGTPFEGLTLMLRGKLQETADEASRPGGVGSLEQRVARKGQPKVAVVTAAGTIVQGPVPPTGPGANQPVIDATKLSGHLNALLEDPDVRAVVVRVNSPGGSALASDTIYHEMQRLRAAGKPVVVSMGDVAASGGYYMAAAADAVVAQPGTVTGSIGVVAGKINVGRSLEEVGLRSEAVTVGRNADLLSPFTGLGPGQAAQVEALVDHVYDDFLDKVAKSRGRPVSEVRELAKGRVYSGRQAHQVGLVDELGGLEAAVSRAKALAKLPEDVAVVEHPPRRMPLLLQLLKRSGMMNGAAGGAGASALDSLGEVGAAVTVAAVAAGLPVAGGGGMAAAAAAAATASGLGAAGRGAAEVGAALSLLGGEPQLYSVDAALLVAQV
ncbi:hypothetical protein HYH02_011876 [Chlamydomonas schloesseri]|uniref:Peptidase S49 domain-containing protein n=1 Tax=Chlamydomonas schloesseri TaxID=2026947 RepID=A0A835W368_9CHLO|nr:hypothetical protein HYH02_011876 [Chlamydomonas schloesseri]|eukprot:KAG2435583.1 hypothetical protein HYH02_011876 [Chlamydomonas schloesseri]